ncbi:hypothetical protein HPC49_11410 [Pyxidicoccus fallax]|uniref:Uncharacterized protein n=1 Tax=Pyxidicoccus fallax TaxID=394095 RepID=A0A848LF59_9BACT|nr:hypothetical protein [Pyxidicoccus fallax]NMO17064.1 hypothetical protein [Pyxidicoccus fallax]NPC78846.1 hypothetical protein [Pyxidicoccus fallax]
MSTLRITLAASVAAVGLNGCVYGYVNDASTGSAIQDVTVTVASGTCSGSGCGTPNEKTDSSGLFVFDAYGNRKGEENVKIIMPAAGEEAIRLLYTRSGYRSINVYHKPKYETVTQDGQDYSVSNVQTVYLCALNSPDADTDGICDAAEAQYGTSPTNSDTDGDSLSDFAELFGVGGVDLRYYGANPLKKDVFVELDYYPNLRPMQTALDRVTAAFAAAPVSNPNGSTGISLHLVVDQQIAAADADMDLNPAWTDFDVIKAKYFAPRRTRLFHYALIANQYNSGGSSGLSRGIPAHDFIVTLGNWSTPGGTEQQQAGTIMHELGHNIGLMHGGNENANYKANYLSVMSYTYQLRGLYVEGVDGILDYSRVRVASASEAAVSEISAFAPAGTTTEADLARYGVRVGTVLRSGNASANLDFNGNGVIQAGNIAQDLNNDGDTSDIISASQNDWTALVYHGAGTIGDVYLGDTASLMRAQPFLVAPEKTEQCLTENEHKHPSPKK